MMAFVGQTEELYRSECAEALHATADRLQVRTLRLQGRTKELCLSAKRLKAATERLRDRLESSFPADSEPKR